MPSPRASRAPKKRTKTFTGCWTCRSRGLKCDGARPHCDRCHRSRRECGGYGIRLYWMDQDESGPPQGMQMRRMLDESSRKNPVYSDAFLDSALDELDTLQTPCELHIDPFGVFPAQHHQSPPSLDDETCTFVSSPAPSLDSTNDGSLVLYTRDSSPAETELPFLFPTQSVEIRVPPALQPYLVSATLEERRLFDHWTSTLSGIFLPTPRRDNPFRNVFIPLALGSSNNVALAHPGQAALLHGIYAIAAFHIAETEDAKKDHSLIALKHYKASIALLRQCLAQTGEQPESVFATITLMVSIYVVVGNSSNWRIHIQGGRDWLNSQVASLKKGYFAPILYQLFRCLEVIGLWHNDTHLLESDKSTPLDTVTDTPDEEQTWTGANSYCLDRYFGLPNPIFVSLQSMQMFRRRPFPPSPQEVDDVELGIEHFRATVPPLRPSDDISERLLVHHYMVFYYAARINLLREFRQVPPSAVQDLVQECLQHLELTHSIEQAIRVCGISWPLFVTACEAEGEVLRARVFKLFDKGWQLGIGSIKKAAVVVKKLWEHRDRTGNHDTRERQKIMESMGMDLLLA